MRDGSDVKYVGTTTDINENEFRPGAEKDITESIGMQVKNILDIHNIELVSHFTRCSQIKI